MATNLENDKRVVVKINDRGPFIKGRIIDLSYVAAKELDFIRLGTTKVSISIVDSTYFLPIEKDNLHYVDNFIGTVSNDTINKKDKPEIQNIITTEVKFLYYGVQVASLSDTTHIDKLKKKIEKITKEQVVVYNYGNGIKDMYQVVVGNFKHQKDAITFKKKLKTIFEDAFVTQYKN